MTNRKFDAGRVIGRDRRDLEVISPPVDKYQLVALVVQLLQQRVMQAGGRYDEPLDLASTQNADLGSLAIWVVVGVDNKCAESCRA